jgi:pSer/pThr/pTyr-binding forkhead associated (FHA) protein
VFVLEAMNGPLDGKRWSFEKSIEIGREVGPGGAALPVDNTVSRRHARIEVEDKALTIADLDSSNGTILRGQPVSGITNLEPGEPFIVGRTLMQVLPMRDAAADPAAPP